MPTNAYQTVAQNAYWGNVTRTAFADIGPVISGVDIPSELSLVQRVVLGSELPTADVARIAYRVTIPRMRVGAESEVMRTNPVAWFALVRTDDLRAMIGLWACNGTPLQAAAQGEIATNIQLGPASAVFGGTAVKMDSAQANYAVTDGTPTYAVVTNAAGGTISRGGNDYAFAGPGIGFAGASGAQITKPVDIEGWLITDASAVTL